MKLFQKISFSILLILSLVAMYGCVPLLIGAAVGVGGITYVKGALERNINKDVSQVHEASLSALKDLGIFVITDEMNKHSAVINAEYEDGKKIKIHIDALTEYVSKITIRIGVFGNEEDSQMILNAIEKEL